MWRGDSRNFVHQGLATSNSLKLTTPITQLLCRLLHPTSHNTPTLDHNHLMLGTARHQPTRAKRVAFMEEDSHSCKADRRGGTIVNVLYTVLYLQAHAN